MILVNLEGSCWSVGRDYPTLDSYVFLVGSVSVIFGGDGFFTRFRKGKAVWSKKSNPQHHDWWVVGPNTRIFGCPFVRRLLK